MGMGVKSRPVPRVVRARRHQGDYEVCTRRSAPRRRTDRQRQSCHCVRWFCALSSTPVTCTSTAPGRTRTGRSTTAPALATTTCPSCCDGCASCMPSLLVLKVWIVTRCLAPWGRVDDRSGDDCHGARPQTGSTSCRVEHNATRALVQVTALLALQGQGVGAGPRCADGSTTSDLMSLWHNVLSDRMSLWHKRRAW